MYGDLYKGPDREQAYPPIWEKLADKSKPLKNGNALKFNGSIRCKPANRES